MILRYIVLLFFMFFTLNLIAQNIGKFKGDRFPMELIDTSIVKKRGLEEKIDLLVNDCNWKKKVGKKIDTFWLKTDNGNFFGHSYEYIMDCDNVRLIYWSTSGRNIFPIVDFMIEDLEDESQFVIAKKKHLKNNKKYTALLKE